MEIMIALVALEPRYAASEADALCTLHRSPEGRRQELVGHLDLGVGLKEADDAVGLEALPCPEAPPKRLTRLALVFVQGVDGVEEDHDARGDP